MKYNDNDIEKEAMHQSRQIKLYMIYLLDSQWSCTWRLLYSVKNSVGNFPVILL